MRHLLAAALMCVLHGCGDTPENIDILVHVQPSSLSPATSLRVLAFLNEVPARQPFEFSDKPLDHFWVRFPSTQAGVLRLSIDAMDIGHCAVWHGTTMVAVGPPYSSETTADLTMVQPPKC